jgi:hypothetical protein
VFLERRGEVGLGGNRQLVLSLLVSCCDGSLRELVPGANRELLRKVDSVVADRRAGSQRTSDHLGLGNGLASGSLYHSPR